MLAWRIRSWAAAEDEESESEELVVAHQPTREEGELRVGFVFEFGAKN